MSHEDEYPDEIFIKRESIEYNVVGSGVRYIPAETAHLSPKTQPVTGVKFLGAQQGLITLETEHGHKFQVTCPPNLWYSEHPEGHLSPRETTGGALEDILDDLTRAQKRLQMGGMQSYDNHLYSAIKKLTALTNAGVK